MTFKDSIYRFLQVDQLYCANDGKPLKFPYLKLSMWPQHLMFTWGWFKQTWFGDNRVLRFHDEKCFREFAQKGRLIEIEDQKARQ